MKVRMSLVGLLVAVLAIGFVATGYAADDAAKAVTVRGTVKAVTDVAGCAATVTARTRVGEEMKEVVYNVVDDENGKKLAKDADGKHATIKGTVQTKEAVEWLTVTEFTVMTPKATEKK